LSAAAARRILPSAKTVAVAKIAEALCARRLALARREFQEHVTVVALPSTQGRLRNVVSGLCAHGEQQRRRDPGYSGAAKRDHEPRRQDCFPVRVAAKAGSCVSHKRGQSHHHGTQHDCAGVLPRPCLFLCASQRLAVKRDLPAQHMVELAMAHAPLPPARQSMDHHPPNP